MLKYCVVFIAAGEVIGISLGCLLPLIVFIAIMRLLVWRRSRQVKSRNLRGEFSFITVTVNIVLNYCVSLFHFFNVTGDVNESGKSCLVLHINKFDLLYNLIYF